MISPSRILEAAGVDRAVGWALLGRSWSVLAGVFNVVFIVQFLSITQQGYYYTFGSLLAAQVFFELGLSFVILQFVSHERAHLTWTTKGTLAGDTEAEARLHALARWALRWYSVAGLLMILTVIPAGLWFFSRNPTSGSSVEWQAPWVLLGLATAGNLMLSPVFGAVEGTGQVAHVSLVRLLQALAFSVALWTSLALDVGLYAAPAAAFAVFGMGSVALIGRNRSLLVDLLKHTMSRATVSWRHEVWPFQWRIAVSIASGYLVFYLFSPVLFAYRGPTEAGQMGMSMGIATAISAAALSWMTTKAAPFGAWVARRNWSQLDTVFFRTLKQSLAVCILGCGAAWLLVVGLGVADPALAERMLPPAPLAALFLATVVNTAVICEAIYLRSHKKEPFLWMSLVSGLLTGLSTWLLGRSFGASGMVAGYLAISIVFGLGVGTMIFAVCRRRWHAVPSDEK